jgi:Predicted nucleotide-binding protein containing TIR-like domain
MAQQIVFYSWQSWTDAGANRNFIEDCLERAIKEIRKNDSLRLDPVIDRDIQGVPGSADIANTILSKIVEADVFVADVSFVNDAAPGRRSPNPNVLVELGYALAKLGEGKVVCIHNLATGRVEDLPFDIRGRTVATYDLPPKAGVSDEATWLALRAEQRKQLVGRLKHAITTILSATDPAVMEFVNEMVEKLILVIIFGGEVEDRPIKPGSEVMRAVIGGVATDLRAMACQEPAARLNLGQRLDQVASAIEEAIHFTRCLGKENHDEYGSPQKFCNTTTEV